MIVKRKKGIFFGRGQSLTELALVISLIGLALIAMEIYFKRGMQGKIKDLTDNIISSEQEVYQQDTSGLLVNTSSSTLNTDTNTTYTLSEGGGLRTESIENTVTDYSSQVSD